MSRDTDIPIARRVLNPFIEKRTKGQGSGTKQTANEKFAKVTGGKAPEYARGVGSSMAALFAQMKKPETSESGVDTGAGLVTALKSKSTSSSIKAEVSYWTKKGLAEAAKVDGSGLWCEESASIIVYMLTQEDDFKSKMEVVCQGDPKMHGHWYVVANRPEEGRLEYSDTKYLFDKECFVIDLWGAINNAADDCINDDPPDAFYDCMPEGSEESRLNHNKIKVICTIPAK